MFGNEKDVLAKIGPSDLVLDVGGWACPFNRANVVIDSGPYETRGFYRTIGLPGSQGGEQEQFTGATWVQRDICSKEPWPFKDKQFAFSICSHTLEDIRDPLFVCSELIRVSKAGYIETPSRLWESCRGVEHKRIAGLSHHRWLVEASENHLQFTPKFHCIHAEFDLALPSSFSKTIDSADAIVRFFWQDTFTFSETLIHGNEAVYASLSNFVRKYYRYPAMKYWWRRMARLVDRGVHKIGRTFKSVKVRYD